MNVLSMLQPKCSITYLHDHDTLRDGLNIMRQSGYTAVPVIKDNGSYAGTVNEGDFLRAILDHEMGILDVYTIRDIMKPGRNPAVKDAVSEEVLVKRSMEQNFVPMTDDRGCFIGIVTRRDIIKNIIQDKKQTCFVLPSYKNYS